MSYYEPEPIILADTSGLLHTAELENATFGLPTRDGGNVISIPKILDELSGKGKRTIIMPGSVLTELFPTVSGRLTLARDEHGKPTFPLGAHRSMFHYATEHTNYQYLSEMAQEGNLRCYDSPEEMLAAHEIDRPKGGIVFVSMNEPRDDTGFLRSRSKNTRFLYTHEQDALYKEHIRTARYAPDKLHLLPPLPTTAGSELWDPADRPERHVHGSTKHIYKDKGDRDLKKLVHMIYDYNWQQQAPHKLLLLTDDGPLLESVETKRSVLGSRPLMLINAMTQLGMLDQKAGKASMLGVAEMCDEDKNWKSVASALMTPDGIKALNEGIIHTKRWLEDTKPALASDPAESKSR